MPHHPKVFIPPGGKMGELIRSKDWSKTPLGPMENWPPTLLTNLATILELPTPFLICWGRELTMLYNDAYISILGDKHIALGKCLRDVWSEAWDVAKPLFDKALDGEAVTLENAPFTLLRHGYPGETWFDFSISPLRDNQGKVAGALNTAIEITKKEKELRESQERFSKAFHSNPASMAISDIETGRLIDINMKWLQILGYTREETIGRTTIELKIWTDPDQRHRLIRKLLAEGSFQEAPAEFITKSGKIRHALWSAELIEYGGKVAMLSLVYDITERKRAEDALRESEARYRELVQNANSAIIRWNANGTLTFFNEYAQTFFGYSADEILGKHVGMLAPHKESTGADLSGLIQDILDNPERYANFVNENVRKDGSRAWMAWTNKPILDEHGNVTEILAVGTDITERMGMEEALKQARDEAVKKAQESNERGRILNAMMDHIPMGITIADAPDVTIRTVSRFGRELIGRSLEKLQGIAVDQHVQQWDIYLEDGVTIAKNEELPLTRATQQGEIVTNEVWVLGRSDGTRIPILCSAAPIRDDNGLITGGVIGWQDITERKQADEALKKLADTLEVRIKERTLQLERAHRAKDDFLANMSHEIRTPMAGVLGLAEILLHQELPANMQDDLEIIRSSAESVMTLLKDLFDLSRINQAKLEFHHTEFDLRGMVREAVAPFEFQALSKDLDFIVSIDESVPSQILCDKDRLGQVLKNLVSNAIKFTEQGFVRVHVQADKNDEDTLRLNFAVADSGMGIPKNKQKEVFSAFTQLDPSYSKKFAGLGLGLAISKSLVEGMGGEISVESARGKGATFRFYVTCGIVTEDQKLKAPSITLHDLPPMTILIAEDNAINRLFLRRALVTAGHKVGEAENGRHALAKLKDTHFDLVLMDIQMPEMDGVEATRRIRTGKHGRSDVPIIALTAYAMKGDREKFMEGGMNGYVTKPVDFGELARAIAEVCGIGATT